MIAEQVKKRNSFDQVRDNSDEIFFWAKTVISASAEQIPGISVFNHCMNVGSVAARLVDALPISVSRLLPSGTVPLAALHDIGKITLGFQAKCPKWLESMTIDDSGLGQISLSVSDHALVSQHYVQEILRRSKAGLWAVAVGAHHGRPKGRSVKTPLEYRAEWTQNQRHRVAEELINIFGPLPDHPPAEELKQSHTDIWLLAGLITVSDWIGSNEAFFSPTGGQPPEATLKLAARALAQIGLPGGQIQAAPFKSTFGFDPNAVQQALFKAVDSPALIIVEAPMGCGKTEAALAVAQKLIAAGHHHGIYFALPTQVTSNRIHRRVARFLKQTLVDSAHLRLAHGNSWLESNSDLQLRPTLVGADADTGDPDDSVADARSWFASSKQALLAPYGVGTIDQALQGMVAVKHFFVRRFALAGKVVILDEVHSYDVYTGALVTALIRELLQLGCTVIVLSATLSGERRRELLAAAYSFEEGNPSAYPLLTVANRKAAATQVAPATIKSTEVSLRATAISEDDTLAELIVRAEAGQHVLWIRNTVAEAQSSFRLLRAETPIAADPADRIPLGLLHSRFPLSRRAEIEEYWLNHLGRDRPASGPGSILIATQVVEQSVDIDLDFIVTDLAPTDMILQRAGRLWRHQRTLRAATKPELWIRVPDNLNGSDVRSLKKALGRSARVYAPWVLLRTSAVFAGRKILSLPKDIRPLLEATYAAPHEDEPTAWHELHDQLEGDKRKLTANAEAAMLVLGRPTLSVDDDSDQALTRRKGPPTINIVLLSTVEMLPGNLSRLTALDNVTRTVSHHEWDMDSAKFLHRWIVRVPKWIVPQNAPSQRWLSLHVNGAAAFATVSTDGRLVWDGDTHNACYHPDYGVYSEKPTSTSLNSTSLNSDNDDDEFDY